MEGAVIRPARPEDLDTLVEIYNHYVLHTAVTFDTEPFTADTRRPWFEEHATQGRHRLLVAVDAHDEVCGYASSGRFRAKRAYDPSVECSVYLREGRAGRGLGTALYTALFAALRREDVHRAYGGVALPNPASIALHRKLGFTPIGVYREVGRKFGRWWDVAWYEKAIEGE